MRAIDTSAWIEWLLGSSAGRTVTAELPENADWLVPTVVQLELIKWLIRERSTAQASGTLAFSNTCVVVPLSTSIAMAAAIASRSFKLSTADAIIYATAQAHGAELVTCDAHFKDLADVVYIAKS
jgi:predicted nucleic acid-binding protein